ncbi:MAG: hypothetical protein ACYCT9_06195 [Leptospirillum sp.]
MSVFHVQDLRGAPLGKRLTSIFLLLLVLIPVVFYQMGHGTDVYGSRTSFKTTASVGLHVTDWLSNPKKVVDASSDGDDCTHPFVSEQSSWECHHPKPSYLLTSSLLAQATLPMETVSYRPLHPDNPIVPKVFFETSSIVLPPDHPPRVFVL